MNPCYRVPRSIAERPASPHRPVLSAQKAMTRSWRSRYSPHLTFSPEQLRQVSQVIAEEFSPCGSDAAAPELVLMPVDPYHLHAYWHIDADDTPAVWKQRQPSGKNDLRLRIYCRHEAQSGQATGEPWFDVAVGTEKNWCDVRLPLDNLRCRAALGTKSDSRPFTPLLFSNEIHAPKAGISPAPTAASEGAKNGQLERQAASTTTNHCDERLIHAIKRQALSDQGIQVELNPHTGLAEDHGMEQTLMAPALSSHTIARRHIE